MCANHEGVFNLSASFRDDSDFSSVYWTDSNIYWSLNDEFKNIDIYDTKKLEKFAVMLASNCEQRSNRDKIVREISKFISIDVYGRCGSKKCPNRIDCQQYLAQEYMFYLAFENSLCYGYITEKIFDTVNLNVIPVVLAYANYSYYLPKSAYINVLDFDSPKSLADYMNYLARNKTAYNFYFAWKRFIRTDTKKKIGGYLCEMCIKLQLEENLGYIESKKISSTKKMFGMYETCLDAILESKDIVYFNFTKLTRNLHTYWMSPE